MPTDHAAEARKAIADHREHHELDPGERAIVHALLSCSAQLNAIRAELAALNDHARKER